MARGTNGQDGEDGEDGATPHIDLTTKHWIINGIDTGIVAQGANGVNGKSAYQSALDGGFVGTESQWILSLKGTNGTNGTDGINGSDGQDGITPHIGIDGYWYIGEINTNIKAQGADGQDGENGVDGQNGITPHIGANLNWWIGETDTGILAEGQNGIDGQDGSNGLDGADGVPIELRNSTEYSYIQWKYTNEDVWRDLVPLGFITGPQGLTGETGDSVELRINETHIQWKLTQSAEWTDLIALSALQGSDGADGQDGIAGESAYEIAVRLGFEGTEQDWLVSLQGLDGTDGTNGTNGTDGADGKEVELQKSATHIQWRYVGDATWIDIVALADLSVASNGEKKRKHNYYSYYRRNNI